MSGIKSESLVMVSPEVSQAVPLHSRRGCLVAVVVKSRPGGRGCAGRPSLVEPGGSSGGKRALPHAGEVCTTLVPTALARNRNERLSRFTPNRRASPGG